MNSSGRVSTNRLAVVGTAIVCVLIILASLLPIQVNISTGGMLSIGLTESLGQGGIATAYAKVNLSGCMEYKGNVQIRIDFYLEPTDIRYPNTVVNGTATPFHSHFIYLPPTLTVDDIKAAIDIHLANFYYAYQQGWDAVAGGMRHGWATETRISPTDYSGSPQRVSQSKNAVKQLTGFMYKPAVVGEGQFYPATEIDVGPGATDRASSTAAGYTYIDKNNPANASDKVDTFEVWAATSMTGTNKVGVFYVVSGDSYKWRAGATIGTVTSGAKRTFTGLSISVTTGDFAAIYFSVGTIEEATSGGTAVYYKNGDVFYDSPELFLLLGTGYVISIYGTGGAVVIPTVTTQAATDVLSTSCTGNGNITATGGANATRRGFCYMVGQAGDPTTANSTAYDDGNYGTGAYTKSITGLTPSTYYRVRAYTVNSAGTGYGDTVQVTTLPGDPASLTDTAHNGVSVDLSWTKGTGADYTLIRYRTDQYPTGTSDGTLGYNNTASTTSVGSLTYGQIYYFRAWAWNSTTTLYSSGTSDRTCYTDPNAPTSFIVTETTCNSTALNWTLGTGADKTMVRYRSDQYPTNTTDGTQAYFNTGTSVNVTSLDPGQIYYFRAWSYDTESGYYDSYAQLTETTHEIPTAITQAASNVACTTARINGKISDDGGASSEARFRYRAMNVVENFTSYTEIDPNNHIELVGTNHIDYIAHNDEDTYLYKDKGIDYFGSDWEHKLDLKPVSSSEAFDGTDVNLLSNDIDDAMGLVDADKTYVTIGVEKHGSSYKFSVAECYLGSYYSSALYTYTLGTWYYLTIQKVGTSLTCKIYSDNLRTILLTTLSLTLHGDHKFRYIFPVNIWNDGWDKYLDMDVENLIIEGEWIYTDWQNTLETDDTYYEDLTDLECSTEYEFQTQTKNSCGESDWTASAYFETTTPSITNLPTTNDFGILEVGTTANTAINYFTLNNTGNCVVDITIQGTNLAGGDDTWTLDGTATPGENIYGLYAGLDDADDNFDIVVNATANAFVADLPEATTQAWGLKLYMPTSLSGYDAQQMSGNITLIASAA